MKRPGMELTRSALRMPLFLLSFSALISATLPLPALSQPKPPPKPAAPPPEKPGQSKSPGACASVTGSVRAEAFGYTHIVTLRNTCDKAVECDVWTDVDPTPRNVLRAAPGESVELVTRIGAPSREVVAQKECRFRGR